MRATTIQTDAYFDGEILHRRGPYLIEICDGVIDAIHSGHAARRHPAPSGGDIVHTPFLMPGLVDGHVHMFLDGDELDFARRKAHLAAGFDTMMATARANVAHSVRAGVTVVRDAGDRFGVNTAMRDELRGPDAPLTLRSAGTGLKKPKRYGGFIARDMAAGETPDTAVADLARAGDELKVILTGIIDFELGEVPGAPQFSVAELTALVRAAHRRGRKTMVHCSGLAGLRVAVAAGVGSIEHGFFMNRDILTQMADRQIAWVPTFSPVDFQWRHPEHAGWNPDTVANLRRILDNHREHLALAARLGVPLVAGSDAGSYGVGHGRGLIEELHHMLASGLRLQEVLTAASSRPRKLWSLPGADIATGRRIDAVGLKTCPFQDDRAFFTPAFTFKTSIRMLD